MWCISLLSLFLSPILSCKIYPSIRLHLPYCSPLHRKFCLLVSYFLYYFSLKYTIHTQSHAHRHYTMYNGKVRIVRTYRTSYQSRLNCIPERLIFEFSKEDHFASQSNNTMLVDLKLVDLTETITGRQRG